MHDPSNAAKSRVKRCISTHLTAQESKIRTRIDGALLHCHVGNRTENEGWLKTNAICAVLIQLLYVVWSTLKVLIELQRNIDDCKDDKHSSHLFYKSLWWHETVELTVALSSKHKCTNVDALYFILRKQGMPNAPSRHTKGAALRRCMLWQKFGHRQARQHGKT